VKALILAGGFATRLHPLTLHRPKPLLPIAGKPILQFILEDPGLPDRPILTTNRQFEPHFEAWLAETGFDVDLLVEPVLSEDEKLGSIGAIAHAIRERQIDDDLLVIAGDNLFGFPLGAMLASYRGHPLIALHDKKTEDAVRNRYGVAVVEEGRIIEFQEKPEEPRSTLASTACYIYPRSGLALVDRFRDQAPDGHDAPGFFNAWLLAEHEIQLDAFINTHYWFDVGDRTSYIEAVQHFCAGDSWIDSSSEVLESSLRDTVVLSQANIRGCDLSGCIIAEHCCLLNETLRDTVVTNVSRPC